ncbi:MAG: methionine--tRNA ligase, partial [Candidatus Bipolaricaulota bacterium]|nr:methionine--tRNA ligase [Candidatus Bipolaricaulota bacterium]
EIRAKIEAQKATVALATAAHAQAATAEGGGASFEDFQRLDLRVGVVRGVSPVEGAEKLWRLSVDLGAGMRTCVAGLRGSYEANALLGKSVVVVANLAPRTIRGIRSEVMILATQGEKVVVIAPDGSVDPGSAVG